MNVKSIKLNLGNKPFRRTANVATELSRYKLLLFMRTFDTTKNAVIFGCNLQFIKISYNGKLSDIS